MQSPSKWPRIPEPVAGRGSSLREDPLESLIFAASSENTYNLQEAVSVWFTQ